MAQGLLKGCPYLPMSASLPERSGLDLCGKGLQQVHPQLLLTPHMLPRSPGGRGQDMVRSSWEQSSRWTSNSKLTSSVLDPVTSMGNSSTGLLLLHEAGCPLPRISFVEQPMLVFLPSTSFPCCFELVGQQHRSAEASQLV